MAQGREALGSSKLPENRPSAKRRADARLLERGDGTAGKRGTAACPRGAFKVSVGEKTRKIGRFFTGLLVYTAYFLSRFIQINILENFELSVLKAGKDVIYFY